MNSLQEKPIANHAAVKPEGGRKWWRGYFEAKGDDVARRFSEAGAIYWKPAQAMPLDLFSYLREASLCFSVSRFLAAISMSSALVEIIISRDSRMAGRPNVHRIYGWATLNNRNLREAMEAGLPVDVLCEDGENLGEGQPPIRFVRLRHRLAHGDLRDFPEALADYSPPYEEEASGQLNKAMRFLVAWFNSTPDIQGPVSSK
ncbi:hypothetical protein MYX77_04755 [Acidobacteriia bacterium AH_259_A11_L15]|nr:hypothetical protein [Acidobacteriia bacterium AH_259_A11_L15]